MKTTRFSDDKKSSFVKRTSLKKINVELDQTNSSNQKKLRRSISDKIISFKLSSSESEKKIDEKLCLNKKMKNIDFLANVEVSKPKITTKMSEEDIINYIHTQNKTIASPVRERVKLTNSGPICYRRNNDTTSRPVTFTKNEIRVAKNSWNARDSDEISVVNGDKISIKYVESTWGFGRLVNDDMEESLTKYGWFPLSTLIVSNSKTEITIRSPDLQEEEEKSIIKNKKRFALRLENFIKHRPSEEDIIAACIIEDKLENVTEMYSKLRKPVDSPRTKSIHLFNKKPSNGVKRFLECNYSIVDISKILLNSKIVDKKVLGDYLGDSDEMSCSIRGVIFDSLDFTHIEYDMALRRFLDVFHLPGEAQKIDRLMQTFASKYYDQQKGTIFLTKDAVYVLAFSTIMLNTDLHNISIKKKMTKEQFLQQNRGVNGGKNFSKEFLDDLYDTIEEDELRSNSILPAAFKRGWLSMSLTKNSETRKFKKIWVMLDKNGFYCFHSIVGLESICTIPIRIVTKIQKTKKPFEFRIKTKEKAIFIFKTRNVLSQNSWVSNVKFLKKNNCNT